VGFNKWVELVDEPKPGYAGDQPSNGLGGVERPHSEIGLGLLVKPEPVVGWYRALVLRKWAAETAVSAGRSMTNDTCGRQRDLFFEPHTCGNCSIPKRDDRRSRGWFQAGEQLLQLYGEGPAVLFRQS